MRFYYRNSVCAKKKAYLYFIEFIRAYDNLHPRVTLTKKLNPFFDLGFCSYRTKKVRKGGGENECQFPLTFSL